MKYDLVIMGVGDRPKRIAAGSNLSALISTELEKEENDFISVDNTVKDVSDMTNISEDESFINHFHHSPPKTPDLNDYNDSCQIVDSAEVLQIEHVDNTVGIVEATDDSDVDLSTKLRR